MDPRVIGIAAALVSAASWAVGSILFKRLGESLSPVAMTLSKGIVSVVLLAGALAVAGWQPVPADAVFWLVVSGLLGIALADTFFFAALQLLGPQALVMLLTLSQVLTAGFAVAFLGERPSMRVWCGIGLVMAGVGLVLWVKLDEADGRNRAARLRGVGFGSLSVLCMAVATIVAKVALRTETSALQGTFIRMLAGMAGVGALGLVAGRIGLWIAPLRDRRLALRFLLAVCVVTFGGFYLSLVAIKYADVAVANTLNSTEPLFLLPLSAIFLGEKLTLRAVAGTLTTLAGIGLICVG